MAAITTADVTYTQGALPTPGAPWSGATLREPGRVQRVFKLTFPTTNTDYQTGGVPLLKANMGCPRSCNSLKVIGITASATASMNPLWQWNGDTVNPKLVGLREAAAVADGVAFDELANNFAITASSQNVFVEVEGY